MRAAAVGTQYSLGNRNVVTLRSDSVMIQSVFSPNPLPGFVGSMAKDEGMREPSSPRARCWPRPLLHKAPVAACMAAETFGEIFR